MLSTSGGSYSKFCESVLECRGTPIDEKVLLLHFKYRYKTPKEEKARWLEKSEPLYVKPQKKLDLLFVLSTNPQGMNL